MSDMVVNSKLQGLAGGFFSLFGLAVTDTDGLAGWMRLFGSHSMRTLALVESSQSLACGSRHRKNRRDVMPSPRSSRLASRPHKSKKVSECKDARAS